MVPDHFTLDTSLSLAERHVMVVIAMHCRQRPWSLSIGLIAKEASVDRKTVKTAIRALVDAKYLEVDHNYHQNQQRPSTFSLGPGWFEELPPF